jgi:hypothetical protein
MAKVQTDENLVAEVVAEKEALISLSEFANTFKAPVELMGGFVYTMQKEGRVRDTAANYAKAFEEFRNRPIG